MTASVRPGVYAVIDDSTAGQASIIMFNGTGIDNKTVLKNGGKTYTLGTVSYKVHGTTVTKKITTARTAPSKTAEPPPKPPSARGSASR